MADARQRAFDAVDGPAREAGRRALEDEIAEAAAIGQTASTWDMFGAYRDGYQLSVEQHPDQAQVTPSLRYGWCARLAVYCEPLYYYACDEKGTAPGQLPYAYRLLAELRETGDEARFAVRSMPIPMIQLAIGEIERLKAKGYAPLSEFEQYTNEATDESLRVRLEYELARRRHYQGRTLYLQSNAALGVERGIMHAAPGINPRPFQTLVANFLSLSFNPRQPVVPRYPDAAAVPAPASSSYYVPPAAAAASVSSLGSLVSQFQGAGVHSTKRKKDDDDMDESNKGQKTA